MADPDLVNILINDPKAGENRDITKSVDSWEEVCMPASKKEELYKRNAMHGCQIKEHCMIKIR